MSNVQTAPYNHHLTSKLTTMLKKKKKDGEEEVAQVRKIFILKIMMDLYWEKKLPSYPTQKWRNLQRDAFSKRK